MSKSPFFLEYRGYISVFKCYSFSLVESSF